MSHDLREMIPQIRAAAERGQAERILLDLLSIWPSNRAPALAAAIARLSGRTLRREIAPDIRAWHQIASRCDPLSVADLLSGPISLQPSALCKQLRALERFPPDPRVARLAERALAQMQHSQLPLTAQATVAARALLYRHGPSAHPDVDPLVQELSAAAALPPSPEEELLTAIYADPDSDGPRHVYADWLQQQGDPMGHHLSLALSGAQMPVSYGANPSLQRFICHHMGILAQGALSYRRGFVDRVVVSHGPLNIEMPGWSLVEEVEIHEPSEETAREMPKLAQLPRLRLVDLRLLGQSEDTLRVFWPTLERIAPRELGLWAIPASARAQLSTWPSLRCLWRHVYRTPVPIDAGALPALSAPLDLGLWSHSQSTSALLSLALRAAPSAPEQIREIRVQRPHLAGKGLLGLSIALSRDERGELRRLSIRGVCAAHIRELQRIVPRDCGEQISGVSVEAHPGEPPEVGLLAGEALALALGRS